MFITFGSITLRIECHLRFIQNLMRFLSPYFTISNESDDCSWTVRIEQGTIDSFNGEKIALHCGVDGNLKCVNGVFTLYTPLEKANYFVSANVMVLRYADPDEKAVLDAMRIIRSLATDYLGQQKKLHGGCIANNEDGIVFCGNKRSGKSRNKLIYRAVAISPKQSNPDGRP